MNSYGNLKVQKNSLFLKITEGKPQTIRILDADPVEQFTHTTAEKKIVPCGGEMCGYCGEGMAKSQRFVTNAWSHTDQKVYLWSFGPMIANSINSIAQSLAKDDENIMNHDLEVSVTGTGLATKYTVQLRIKSQAVPEGLKLHEIKTKKSSLDEIRF